MEADTNILGFGTPPFVFYFLYGGSKTAPAWHFTTNSQNHGIQELHPLPPWGRLPLTGTNGGGGGTSDCQFLCTLTLILFLSQLKNDACNLQHIVMCRCVNEKVQQTAT